jgi:hypothetical protein
MVSLAAALLVDGSESMVVRELELRSKQDVVVIFGSVYV